MEADSSHEDDSAQSSGLNNGDFKPIQGHRYCVLPIVVFLILCLAQCSWFLVRLGPLTSPDPDMHGPAAYTLATGKIFSPTHKEFDGAGNQVLRQSLDGDERFLYLSGKTNVLDIGAIQLSIKGDASIQQQKLANSQPKVNVTIPDAHHANRANQYFPLLYAPQGTGLRIGLSIHLSPYASWQLARITNIITFIIIWGVAIWLIPRGKWVLVAIGSMPSIVYLLSSLMPDGLIIALCGLFTAMLIRTIVDNRHSSKLECVIYSLVLLYLLYGKIFYALPVLIIFALPHTLMNIKTKILTVFIPVTVFCVTFIPWELYFGGLLAIANVKSNLHDIVSDPTRIGSLTLHSIMQIPRMFIHQPIWFFPQFVLLLTVWLCCAINALVERSANSQKRVLFSQWLSRNRYCVTILMLSFSAVMCMYGFLALTWNDLGNNSITALGGFQLRYIYPLLPCCVFAFVPNTVVNKEREVNLIAANA
ncbi:MAG: DUF2142 domain-containing protein [Bifidobacterium aquikefiri]|uniref:DUF2142 domain-containing protein n=1 Tax=Bifidobacterium aquikefiri TaxID=1653207 RepID=UPI0013035CB7|nr:DUF2142 domain-containing protein [Bifidobacterium aquikefiri]